MFWDMFSKDYYFNDLYLGELGYWELKDNKYEFVLEQYKILALNKINENVAFYDYLNGLSKCVYFKNIVGKKFSIAKIESITSKFYTKIPAIRNATPLGFFLNFSNKNYLTRSDISAIEAFYNGKAEESVIYKVLNITPKPKTEKTSNEAKIETKVDMPEDLSLDQPTVEPQTIAQPDKDRELS